MQIMLELGSTEDRCFGSRYCICVGGDLVTWRCKNHNIIVRSSVEAEYRAMTQIDCEMTWLQILLSDLGVTHDYVV